jgi:[ribosomal protein S18]-alanine N-acetyltransferase
VKDKGVNDWLVERLLSASEIDAILAIEEASFTNPWTREMYVAEIENHDVAHVYFARSPEGPIVGFCSCWLVADEVHINNLGVLPAYRRGGVATALLRHVLREGTSLGATRATLEVRRSNEPARLLYERFGFTVAGVRRGYYTKPVEDALVLWRDGLAPPHERS